LAVVGNTDAQERMVIQMVDARFVQIAVRGNSILALDAAGTVWLLTDGAVRWEPLTTERLQPK
jgi:hypothetical protein